VRQRLASPVVKSQHWFSEISSLFCLDSMVFQSNVEVFVVLFSYRNGKNKNRGKLDIVREMLSIASVKVRKTRIMYQANLSFVQVERYLQSLLESGLVESFDGAFYLITPKGKEFLQIHAEYLTRVRRLGEEAAETEKSRLQLEGMCVNNKKHFEQSVR
jgi:predicted transcriptional regulator